MQEVPLDNYAKDKNAGVRDVGSDQDSDVQQVQGRNYDPQNGEHSHVVLISRSHF